MNKLGDTEDASKDTFEDYVLVQRGGFSRINDFP